MVIAAPVASKAIAQKPPQLIEVIERHKNEHDNYDYLVQTCDRKGTRYNTVSFGSVWGGECLCEDRLFNSGERSRCKHQTAVHEIARDPRWKWIAIADIIYNPELSHQGKRVKWQGSLLPNGSIKITSSLQKVKFWQTFSPTVEIPIYL